jgi:8-oxo-dGTP diphosphatase
MKTIFCAAVIVRRGNDILLGKRTKRYGKGQYQVPGGACEKNEKPHITAIRELEEETGLRANTKNLRYVGNVSRSDEVTGQIYMTQLYEVTKFTGNPVNKEPTKNAAWEWHSLENLPKNLFELGSFLADYAEKNA